MAKLTGYECFMLNEVEIKALIDIMMPKMDGFEL
jgi:CheY-like chemotaxis protein